MPGRSTPWCFLSYEKSFFYNPSLESINQVTHVIPGHTRDDLIEFGVAMHGVHQTDEYTALESQEMRADF